MNIELIEKDLKNMHAGQYDKAGFEYYKHPIWVKENLPVWVTDDLRVAALLHDVIEDTLCSVHNLVIKHSISSKCVYFLDYITKRKNENYDDYIDRICDSKDIEILILKLTDMKHNIDPVRLSILDPKTRERLVKKYMKNYFKLRSAYLNLYDQILEKFDIIEDFLVKHSTYEKLNLKTKNDIISRYLDIENNVFDIIDLCEYCPFFTSRYKYPEDVGDLCNNDPCDILLIDIISFNGDDSNEHDIIYTPG